MQNLKSKQSVLIITGMHRSGTSLTASLLQSAGVDIGQRFIEGGEGNVKGHFENLDFVGFHESVLHSQGISLAGWTLKQLLPVQEQYLDRAKLILKSNSEKKIWGWKDPRTTLFLNFWVELIPEAKFVFVYRSPWEVVDSLYRRGDDVFHCNPNFALKIWLTYNNAIINFYDNFSEQCVIFNLSHITSNPNVLIEGIDTKFGIHLSPVANLYEDSLLQRQISSSHRPTLIKHYFPEALELYHELGTRASTTNGFSSLLVDELIQFPTYKEWVFQDWLDVRRTERELKISQSQVQQTQIELERSQSQVQQTQTELERSQAQVQQTQIELERSQAQVQQTQTELERSQAQVQQTQTELERSQAQLKVTCIGLGESQEKLCENLTELANLQLQVNAIKEELQQTQTQLATLQTSKFWKLYTQWLNLKRYLGFGKKN